MVGGRVSDTLLGPEGSPARASGSDAGPARSRTIATRCVGWA